MNPSKDLSMVGQFTPRGSKRDRINQWFQTQKKALKNFQVIFLMVIVVITGICNTISGKISLTPLGSYAPMQGFFNTFIYILFYLLVYGVRRAIGSIPKGQLGWPWSIKSPTPTIQEDALTEMEVNKEESCSLWDRLPPIKYFILIGVLDSLTTILRLSSIPKLPGALASVLPETNLFFSTLIGFVFLNQKYTYWQLWSLLVLMSAVLILATPQLFSSQSSSQTLDPLFVILMAISPAPSVLSFSIKEKLFKDYPHVDLFVIQIYSNLSQMVFLPLLSPIAFSINTNLIMGRPFLHYLMEALMCMVGIDTSSSMRTSNCAPMPYPYIIYMVFNISYNVLVIVLLKQASAFIAFLVQKTVTPSCVLLYAISWPLLKPSDLTIITPYTYATVITTVIGFLIFRYAALVKAKYNLGCCSPVCSVDMHEQMDYEKVEEDDKENDADADPDMGMEMGLDGAIATMGMDLPSPVPIMSNSVLNMSTSSSTILVDDY